MTERVPKSRLRVEADFDRLTHYLFRYPAKFHPPVVRALLERYTSEGEVVFDPFCGSGTLLVEAAVVGRPSIGLDVDPVAVAVARAKVHRYQVPRLEQSAEVLLARLRTVRRPAEEYERHMFDDLSEAEYKEQVRSVRSWVPAIPNLTHWFRRYVVIDLARIRRAVEETSMPETHRELFRVVFASIIRNSSNADPVPVSGLEVTAYMKRRDEAGRLVNPFALFERAVNRAAEACKTFAEQSSPDAPAKAVLGDATRLNGFSANRVDAVITSPPYHGAVDYYRRHQLEMFWLGQTNTVEDRLTLLHSYVGRPRVPQSHPYVADALLKAALAKRWEARIRRVSGERADAFRHYVTAMTKVFDGLAELVPSGAPAILIVGHSTWNKSRISTTNLFKECADKAFRLREVLWYPVKNRYMSYSRHNNADINKEYALVFERTRRRHAEPT